MRQPASAFAALGLEPGADRSAIEEAYRRLIKRYHPDRSGGDAARAAEINRAYFELRHGGEIDPSPTAKAGRRAAVRHPGRGPSRRPQGRRRGRLWLVLVLVLAVGGLLLAARDTLIRSVPRWLSALADLGAMAPESSRGATALLNSASLDGSLGETAIAGSIRAAVALSRNGDQRALAAHSRACHMAMRADPGLGQLDRCAAFDDAAAALGDGDPGDDRGAFGASAVTARQLTAASLLSNDYLAIERRLDRIRTRVEMTLPQAARR